jgi:hypothetical protein
MRHPLQIHQAQQLGVQHFITRKNISADCKYYSNIMAYLKKSCIGVF